MIDTKALLNIDNDKVTLSLIKDVNKKKIFEDLNLIKDLNDLVVKFEFKDKEEMFEIIKKGLENSIDFGDDYSQPYFEVDHVYKLYTNFENELDTNLGSNLQKELVVNYRDDLLASYIENRFERLAFNVFDSLQTLVIDDLVIDLGEIRFYERLITILFQNAQEAEIIIKLLEDDKN